MSVHRRLIRLIVALPLLLAVAVLAAGCGSEEAPGDHAPTANIATNTPATGKTPQHQRHQHSSSPAAIGNNNGDFRLETTGGGTFNEAAVFGNTKEENVGRADNYPEVIFRTQFGDITVQLDREKAPQTVDNFLNNYVDAGFYNGTIFHTVKKGELIAGGGFTADYQAKRAGVAILNEADNGLKNLPGTIAMARYPDAVNSATCQFWFNLGENYWLDHTSTESAETFGYCVFGKVVEGMDVLRQIAEVPVTDHENIPSTPVNPIVIESVQRRQPLGPVQ